MKIEVEQMGTVVFLTLVGELDGRGNQMLDKAIRDLIDRKCYKVVLDLSSIRFVGSQTVSLLLSHMKELRAGGGNIRFLNPQRMVLQYMKQNRMIELFEVDSSKAESVRAYEKAEAAAPPRSPAAPNASPAPTVPAVDPGPVADGSGKARFETGEILYANSCMLASLIKLLQSKGILTAEEAAELMDYERLALKGITE